MTVNTQPDSLVLTLDTHDVSCQITVFDFEVPGFSVGDTVLTACPDGKVSEPGEYEPGKLTGEAFTDTKTASGITDVLEDHRIAGTEVPFVLKRWGTAPTGRTYTGTARVNSVSSALVTGGKYSRTAFDLSVTTVTKTTTAP